MATALLALGDRPEDKLPRITAPVLVIRGERDAITTRDWAESLRAACARRPIRPHPRRRACSAFLAP